MSTNEKSKTNLFMRLWRNEGFQSYSGIIFVIIAVCIFMSFRSPNFMTATNIKNILRQISVYGILACGMAFSMMTAGIDLTVGSTAGVCGSAIALLMTKAGVPLIPSILVVLLLGAAIGMVCGLIIAFTDIPPFIMTLGFQIFLRGVCYIMTDGKPVGNLPDNLQYLGLGTLLGVPVPIYFLIAMFVIVAIILHKTTFGRSVYAVGGNFEAAHYSGINSRRVLTLSYTISGLCAGLAGVILTARNASAQPTAGTTYETEAIAACAMGGVSFAGGKGTVPGIFFGALLMGIINNAMNLMYIDSYWQMVVKGLLIVGAVIYSIMNEKRTR